MVEATLRQVNIFVESTVFSRTVAMPKPKVLLTRPDIPEESLELLQSFADVEIQPEERPITKEEILESIKGKDGLLCMLTDPIDKEVRCTRTCLLSRRFRKKNCSA